MTRARTILVSLSALAISLALAAPAIADRGGEGTYGKYDDKVVTNFGYGLMIFFVVFAAVFILLVPTQSLVQVMVTAQIINALLLPFVLVFVMRLSADFRVMGALRSGRFLLSVGWIGTGLLIALSLTLVATSVFGL